MSEVDDCEKIIKNGYAEMCRGFFRLRKAEKYQEEYDNMGIIMSLLMKDRDELRRKYKVNE